MERLKNTAIGLVIAVGFLHMIGSNDVAAAAPVTSAESIVDGIETFIWRVYSVMFYYGW